MALLRGLRCLSATGVEKVVSRQLNTTAQAMAYEGVEYLHVSLVDKSILNVELNNAKKGNSVNDDMWPGLKNIFEQASRDTSVRCIVLTGDGKHFCGGIDLGVLKNLKARCSGNDPARAAAVLMSEIKALQSCIDSVEMCPKPVIAAIHGACVGAGIDLITACDIRYCTADAWFSVKETNLGMAADIGTLARLPKVVRSDSAVRDWCFSGRAVSANEAFEQGLVSHLAVDKKGMMEHTLATARCIAANSPIAVGGTKMNLNYSRCHSVADSLAHVAVWNAAMLQGPDVEKALSATLVKQPANHEDVAWTK